MTMHLTDSHAHLDMYPAEELGGVMARAYAAGVGTVLAIGIGDGPATMGRALEIAGGASGAEGWPVIWASVGIHPQEAGSADAEALARLAELAKRERCVAVGEIGLDYYHVENPAVEVQRAAFVAQMKVAAEARKPIVIHCRTSELATAEAKKRFGAADAWEDVLALIGEHWAATGLDGYGRGGIMHCFSGGVEEARRSLELGFALSFAGNVTYPKAVGIREAATFVPADRILVETDAPFLAPIPHRGERNEPAWVVHTAEALAELRGVKVEELAERTTENFRRLFSIAGAVRG
jgi:TatD DNase family protein